jgi:hypothetical protein
MEVGRGEECQVRKSEDSSENRFLIYNVFSPPKYPFRIIYTSVFAPLQISSKESIRYKNIGGAFDAPTEVMFIIVLLLLSSLSPLCRVFIHIFPRQTMSLSNTMLQLFCRYCLWCPYH